MSAEDAVQIESVVPAWLGESVKHLHTGKQQAAHARQAGLTKPPGSLGRLEEIAVRLAGMQGTERPRLENVRITVFASDHGVAAEGVSAFPQAVTVEMVRNFARGGAAISVLARELGATLEVINVGTVGDPGPLTGVVNLRIAPGTANFCQSPAMQPAQLAEALAAGRATAERAQAQGMQLFIGGEMGIANTTSASALACVFLDLPGEAMAGPGTGLDGDGVVRKTRVIERALDRHRPQLRGALEVLRCLGGFEIAALTGAFLRCAQLGLPVLVDGFIASTAALVAVRLQPQAGEWFLYAHQSAEPGHRHLMSALGAEPLLDIGMRLGEASGAAVALPLLRLACALHNQMATFAEAGVSEKLS
jgi:nicotinate-nucleotide--dimethylbenzimidazole phosphoribosyltransferase